MLNIIVAFIDIAECELAGKGHENCKIQCSQHYDSDQGQLHSHDDLALMDRLNIDEICGDSADNDRKEEAQRDGHEWVHEVADKVVASSNIRGVSSE